MEPQLVSSVGIRPGEIIVGEGQAAGIRMEVLTEYPYHAPFFPVPSPELLTYLGSLSGITPGDEFAWFRDPMHATESKDLYLEDADLRVRFLAIENAFTRKAIGDEAITCLMQGEHRLKDVVDLFPRRPGSKARKVTLIFRSSLWRNVPSNQRQSDFTGIIINIDDMTMTQGHTLNLGILHVAELSPGFSIGIVAKNGSGIVPNAGSFDASIMNWFTPSVHKSLLQKIIRTGASIVSHGEREWMADEVMRYSFETLLMHPGVFVPDIQRFTRGIEAAVKRLAVIILEDSWTSHPQVIMSLLAATVLAQVSKTWLPDESTIRIWEMAMFEARATSYCYRYDNQRTYTQLTNFSMIHLLLNLVRSFQTDVDMTASIASHNGEVRIPQIPLWERMELSHCLDQHCLADIGYYTNRMTDSFVSFNHRSWDKVTGIRPRHGDMINENDLDVIDYRRCQRLMWLQKSFTPVSRSMVSYHTTKSHLPLSMLAGMVGIREVKVDGITAYAMINPDDITSFNAVARPTRDTLSSDNPIRLTDEQKDRVVMEFRRQLTQGIQLNDVPPTLNRFKGAFIHFNEESMAYTMTIGGITRWISDAFVEMYVLPLHEPIGLEKEMALTTTGDGIVIDSSKTFIHLLETTRLEVIRRVLVFIDGYQSVVGVYKLSRDGDGQDYSVSPLDAEAMTFLLKTSIIYPGILQKRSGDGFEVKNPSLFWMIRDRISYHVNRIVPPSRPWTYRLDNRKMWQHQSDSVEQMENRVRKNKRGHLMWIPVGMGKTLIVIRFLIRLIEMGRLPNYVAYLLPPAAIPTIRDEFLTHGFSVHEVDAKKGSNTFTLRPQHINLIRHNHLILNDMSEQLRELANDLFLILDEFHLLFNPSKRTSAALELATLCRDYIGMTGTLIKNERHDDLIEWLTRVTEFEVTTKNYWVAIGAIVSKQVESHVTTIRQNITVQAPPEYYTLVPSSLGGTAHRIDMSAAVSVCYRAVTPFIVKHAIDLLRTEPGVFIVAKDRSHQDLIYHELVANNVDANIIHRLTGRETERNTGPISLRHDSVTNLRVVITTPTFSTSYNMTRFRVRLDSVYFGNQATRDQLDGRMTRICQLFPEVYYYTFHCGILSLIHERYEKTRSISEALKGLAQFVGEDIPLQCIS